MSTDLALNGSDRLMPLASMPVMNAAVVTATMEALKTIRSFVAAEMVEGTDFGPIPGAGEKKVMLLPGAQKVNMLYNCYPEYLVDTHDLGGGHAEFRVTTKLIHRGTGSVIGAGVGSCSTMESKYRWRTAGRVCPNCEKDTIKRSKFPDRATPNEPPGWYCFGKIGGCGANFRHDDPAIVGQQTGRVENQDIHDQRNTVLKMAKKRSLVDASIGLGCLTELFTQDIEEYESNEEEPAPRRQQQSPPKQPAHQPKPTPSGPGGQHEAPKPDDGPSGARLVAILAQRFAQCSTLAEKEDIANACRKAYGEKRITQTDVIMLQRVARETDERLRAADAAEADAHDDSIPY